MKKKIVYILLIFMMLLNCSCDVIEKKQEETNEKTSEATSEEPKTEAIEPVPISEEEAEEIITKIIGTNGGNRIIEFDMAVERNGREYLVVHAYSVSAPMEDSDGEIIQMTYTYGWFYVDKFSGKAFKDDMGRDSKLIPLN